MKITQKQKRLIQDYLNHYYQMYAEAESKRKNPLSFKNQMQCLHDYTTNLVKNNN